MVEQAVEQRVGDGRLSDVFVPRSDGQLTCDERRTRTVTVFDDFQEVVPFLCGKRF